MGPGFRRDDDFFALRPLRVLRVLCAKSVLFYFCPALGSQSDRRWQASSMSAVEPANEKRIQLSPWIGSKSRPGVTATPVSASSCRQKALLSRVNAEISA